MATLYKLASGYGVDSLETNITRIIELEGTTYSFNFRWNTRDESWVITCSTSGGTTIFRTKAKTSVAFNTMYKHRDNAPQGTLLILDTAERGGRVGFETFNLAGRYRLVYLTSE